jgi:hypothetical protein
MACANGHLTIVQRLLAAGAVRCCCRCCLSPPPPLLAAAAFSPLTPPPPRPLPPRVQQNWDVRNPEHNTPLHWACLNGHIEVVRALMDAGAAATALNSAGRTPLDEALSRERTDIFDLLREYATTGGAVTVEMEEAGPGEGGAGGSDGDDDDDDEDEDEGDEEGEDKYLAGGGGGDAGAGAAGGVAAMALGP